MSPAGQIASGPPLTGTKFELSDAEFGAIALIARKRFGLDLQASKKALVYSRLSRRVRHQGLTGFDAYLALVTSPQGAPEMDVMLSALTTNVTHFFREAHHFDLLRTDVLGPLIARAKAGGRVRLWSAGCSAGQEAYSMAATVLSQFPSAAAHDVKILATDVDPMILEKAQSARYSMDELQAIPEPLRQVMCQDAAKDASTFDISDAVRSIVSFGLANLIADWPMRGLFDMIFCRNVAIYFDKSTQERLWPRFAAQLADGGYLVIGHSERLSPEASALFDGAGITAFRKRPAKTGAIAVSFMEDPT